MLPLLLLVIVLGLAQSATAATVPVFYWDMPTQYTDGTPIAPGDVAMVVVYRQVNSGPWQFYRNVSMPSTQFTDVTPMAGRNAYHATWVSTRGSESPPSNELAWQCAKNRKTCTASP